MLCAAAIGGLPDNCLTDLWVQFILALADHHYGCSTSTTSCANSTAPETFTARATFCVVGYEVTPGTEVLRVETATLHYIYDPIWNHTSLEGSSQEQFIQEVSSTRQTILQAAGNLFVLDQDVRTLRSPSRRVV